MRKVCSVLMEASLRVFLVSGVVPDWTSSLSLGHHFTRFLRRKVLLASETGRWKIYELGKRVFNSLKDSFVLTKCSRGQMITCGWKQPWPVPGPSGSTVIRSAALHPGTHKLVAKTIMHWWIVILRIREDTGSNLCLKTRYPKCLHRFPQSLLINTGTVLTNDTTTVSSTQILTLNSWSSCHSPVDSI
jgi:hypothetical protein